MIYKSELEGWELAGGIGVDAGLCWIGDPCYILHQGQDLPETLGKNWSEFCCKLKDNTTSFNYAAGHEGLGVAVSTGWGDGFYPVYVRKENGRVMEARVIFDTTEG